MSNVVSFKLRTNHQSSYHVCLYPFYIRILAITQSLMNKPFRSNDDTHKPNGNLGVFFDYPKTTRKTLCSLFPSPLTKMGRREVVSAKEAHSIDHRNYGGILDDKLRHYEWSSDKDKVPFGSRQNDLVTSMFETVTSEPIHKDLTSLSMDKPLSRNHDNAKRPFSVPPIDSKWSHSTMLFRQQIFVPKSISRFPETSLLSSSSDNSYLKSLEDRLFGWLKDEAIYRWLEGPEFKPLSFDNSTGSYSFPNQTSSIRNETE
jgi:hypothetical protein